MIPLHYLRAKSKMCGQFEFDLIWFCYWFDFVRSHARCGCCSIVSLLFQVVQKKKKKKKKKKVDCKMSTKNPNNYK